jgi:hypothetical protein
MKSYIVFSIALLNFCAALAQNSFGYGVELKMNYSTQLNTNPSKPQDCTFQNAGLDRLGAAAFVEYKGYKHLAFLSKAGYIPNGFRYSFQTPISYVNDQGHTITMTDYRNYDYQYNYLFIDLLAKHSFGKGLITPNFYAGVRGKYLVSKKIGLPYVFEDPTSSYYGYNSFKSGAMGYVIGGGFQMDGIVNVEFETNMDLTHSVSTPVLKVKNWVWTVNIGINISRLIKKGSTSTV